MKKENIVYATYSISSVPEAITFKPKEVYQFDLICNIKDAPDYLKNTNVKMIKYSDYQKLQQRLNELEMINEQHKELNGKLREEIRTLEDELRKKKIKLGIEDFIKNEDLVIFSTNGKTHIFLNGHEITKVTYLRFSHKVNEEPEYEIKVDYDKNKSNRYW